MVVFQLPFITKTQPNTTGLFTCKKKGSVLKNFKDGKNNHNLYLTSALKYKHFRPHIYKAIEKKIKD